MNDPSPGAGPETAPEIQTSTTADIPVLRSASGEGGGPSGGAGSTPNPQLPFPRSPGETPRAYAAFMAYFNLGQARTLQAAADRIGEHPSTLKNWSAKHGWLERIQAFNAGLLHQQAQAQVELQRRHAANWAERLNRFREQEWDAAQRLLSAAQCFLENFGDEDLQKMTLSQVSRALRISSEIGRSALAGAELPPTADPLLSPIQKQMLDALHRLSAPVPPSVSQSETVSTQETRS